MLDRTRQAGGTAAAGGPPYETIEGAVESGLILICDHASNFIPPEYADLGLDARELERHIAYDIGAGAVTRHLAALMGVPAVLSRFSRLLIDPNRGADDPTLIMRLSDGAVVPGNRVLPADEIAHRVKSYYEPYHAAVDTAIDQSLAAGVTPILLSIHSFTEVWKGHPRPWHITVLWDSDPRLPEPLLERLKSEETLIVDENVPYTGELKGDCMNRHGTERGLAHALVEIRQDLIRETDGQQAWAKRLATALGDLLNSEDLVDQMRHIRHYGSRSDRPGGRESV